MKKWVKVLLIIIIITSILSNIIFISYKIYSTNSEKRASNLIYQWRICISKCPFEKQQNISVPNQDCYNECSEKYFSKVPKKFSNVQCSFSSQGVINCDPYSLIQEVATCWLSYRYHQNETEYSYCLNPTSRLSALFN